MWGHVNSSFFIISFSYFFSASTPNSSTTSTALTGWGPSQQHMGYSGTLKVHPQHVTHENKSVMTI
jgi:hypothetical protein